MKLFRDIVFHQARSIRYSFELNEELINIMAQVVYRVYCLTPRIHQKSY